MERDPTFPLSLASNVPRLTRISCIALIVLLRFVRKPGELKHCSMVLEYLGPVSGTGF